MRQVTRITTLARDRFNRSDVHPLHYQSPSAILVGVLIAAAPFGGVASAQQAATSPRVDPAPLEDMLKPIPRKSPEEALATFDVHEGFELQLVAHEPLVFDPICAAFDEDGLLYVAEMRGYPYLPREGQSPLGRIRLLEDTDGDGRFDRSFVFADELLWPSGLAPWKGGVFVAATPNVWYMKDTDGDRVADVRQKIYTGFGTQNQQGMFNNLIWGLDHKVYGSASVNGGEVRPAGDPQAAAVSVNGRDFRFDPVSGELEAVSGRAQFGNTFDDFGNRFLCSESQPGFHVVLPQRYLARNPYVAYPRAINNLAPGVTPIYRISPIEGWRAIRTARRLVAGERPATSAGASHHVIDAAAGITVYRGSAYPPQFRGNVFVGGAQNNLIHRRVLEPDGFTFRSKRADPKTEFIRSTDNWFRPVNFVNAPDGTLYVLDMSREFIESVHIPLDVVRRLDLTSGRRHGRIYRIAPLGFTPPPPPRLSQAATAELVSQLENESGWWRDTAHRLIYERQDVAAVAPLRTTFRQSRSPLARLHALWSLEGLGTLGQSELLAALDDASAGVREHAVRLAEPQLADSRELRDKVLRLADDPAPRVRFQVALTSGEVQGPDSVRALARIARGDGEDRWMRAAVLSSSADCANELLAELLDTDVRAGIETPAVVLRQLAEIVGVRNREAEVSDLLDALAAPSLGTGRRRQTVLGLGVGLKRAASRLSKHTASSEAARALEALLVESREIAENEQAAQSARRDAIELLTHVAFGEARGPLVAILTRQSPLALQRAAIRALADFAEPEVASILLVAWPHYTPSVRREVIEAVLSREMWIEPLLPEIENGRIAAGEISTARRVQLLEHANPTIRTAAKCVFANAGQPNRRQVIDRYQAALSSPGDSERGQEIYRRECKGCHRLGEEGHAVGPNLALSRNRTPEALLTEILDPNRDVEPQYVEYLAIGADGRAFTGIVTAETATTVTLRRAEDAQDTLLRQNIEQLAATGKSIMPEGLEEKVTPQEMADLIAFLLDVQYQIGTEPGIVQ